MTAEPKSSTDILLLTAIQNPQHFMELIEIARSMPGFDANQAVSKHFYEAFIALGDSQIEYFLTCVLDSFKNLLSDPCNAGLLDSDAKIFSLCRLFLRMLALGTAGLDREGRLVFSRATGEAPDALTRLRIRKRINRCREQAVALYHEFIARLHAQSFAESQKVRMQRLIEKCEKHNIEGIFTDNAEMTAQEMALFLWQRGYTAFPTVESMLDELERQIENKKNGLSEHGARYVFKWEMGFYLSDPKGVPVPAAHINELEEVIEQWVAKKNLQLDGTYIGNYNELGDAEEDGGEDG
jgi:hypothetical protein